MGQQGGQGHNYLLLSSENPYKLLAVYEKLYKIPHSHYINHNLDPQDSKT